MEIISIWLSSIMFSILMETAIVTTIYNDAKKAGLTLDFSKMDEFSYINSPFIFIPLLNILFSLISAAQLIIAKDEVYLTLGTLGVFKDKDKKEKKRKHKEFITTKKNVNYLIDKEFRAIKIIAHDADVVINSTEKSFSNFHSSERAELVGRNKRLKITNIGKEDLFNINIPLNKGKLGLSISMSSTKRKSDESQQLSLVLSKDHKYDILIITKKGNVTINDLNTNSLSIKTTNGDINLNRINSLIAKIRSKKGNIDTTIADSVYNYLVFLESENGSYEHDDLNNIVTVEEEDKKLDIKSAKGEIHVKFLGQNKRN